jgi:hypothetical protein
MSLCIIYCMDIRDLMQAAGVWIDDTAKLPLPMPDGRPQILSDLRDHVADHVARGAPYGGFGRYAQSADSQPEPAPAVDRP